MSPKGNARFSPKGLLIKGNTKINNIVFHPVIELPIQQNAQRFLRQYLSLELYISVSLIIENHNS